MLPHEQQTVRVEEENVSQIQTSWLLSNEIQPFNVTSTAFLLESFWNDKSRIGKQMSQKVAERQNFMCDEKMALNLNRYS